VTGQAELIEKTDRGRRRAAGIYGAVVTAAVIAAAGEQVRTRALVVTVIVTLLVYWIAEQYAELLGEHSGGPPAQPVPNPGGASPARGRWSEPPMRRCWRWSSRGLPVPQPGLLPTSG
jgi:hypothetical protein